MEGRIIKITAAMNNNIVLKVIPGHFATNHSHINYYLDMTTMKARQNEAEKIAETMKGYYNATDKIVDTIICMDGTEVIGAYLAQELSQAGILSKNAHKTIYVISPEFDSKGQMIFRENIAPAIGGKNVILLVASATTGKTIRRSLECISYYGGKIQGISAIFSAIKEIDGYQVDSIFSEKDVPNYTTYTPPECPFCHKNIKIDAIVNGFGYSKL